MAKSDLLKQAIADANAVKETALANAKIALQEAFRPRLESMFADKLSEELDDEELPADDMPMDDEGMGDEELPADDFESPESVGVGVDFNNDGKYDSSRNRSSFSWSIVSIHKPVYSSRYCRWRRSRSWNCRWRCRKCYN